MSEPTDPDRFGPSEYLCHAVLRRTNRVSPFDVSRTRFLVLSALANRRLLDSHDIDVSLPRYWYLFGEVVDEHALDRGFFHAPRARHWPGQRYVPAEIPGPSFAVDPDEREAIDAAVAWTVDRLGARSTASLLAHQHREYAPNPFVREAFSLRTFLAETDLDYQHTLGDFSPDEPTTRERIVARLDRLRETYPEEYGELEPLYVRWDRVVRQLLAGQPDFAGVRGAFESFHETLAKVELRLHHRANVPAERVEEWEDERTGVKAAFRERLDRQFARVSRADLAAAGSLGDGAGDPFDADLATWYADRDGPSESVDGEDGRSDVTDGNEVASTADAEGERR